MKYNKPQSITRANLSIAKLFAYPSITSTLLAATMICNSSSIELFALSSSGSVAIGRSEALANYADGSSTTTGLAVAKSTAGIGYHEVAHFTAGADENDSGAIVRITQFSNDRGLYIKGGRGIDDQTKVLFGWRDSTPSDTDVLTLLQDGSEHTVGIGTTAPARDFHVEGTSRFKNIDVVGFSTFANVTKFFHNAILTRKLM